MAKYKSIVTTEAGLVLVEDAAYMGHAIQFTALKTGNGTYDGTEDLAAATDLKNVCQTFGVGSVSKKDSDIMVRAAINNSGVTEGYSITEIGLYAMDPFTDMEFLYAVVIAETGNEDYFPPYTEAPTSITLEMVIGITESEEVTFNVLPMEGAYVPVESFNEQVEIVRKLISGETTVGNANKLGGKDASEYVQKNSDSLQTISRNGYRAIDFKCNTQNKAISQFSGVSGVLGGLGFNDVNVPVVEKTNGTMEELATTADLASYATLDSMRKSGLLSGALYYSRIDATNTLASYLEKNTTIFFSNWTDSTNFPFNYGSGVIIPTADTNYRVILYSNGSDSKSFVVGSASKTSGSWVVTWDEKASTADLANYVSKNAENYTNLDFNTATESKMYSSMSTPSQSGATNYPIDYTGLLIVTGGSVLSQKYVTFNGFVYERSKLNHADYAWSEWKQTATNADLADIKSSNEVRVSSNGWYRIAKCPSEDESHCKLFVGKTWYSVGSESHVIELTYAHGTPVLTTTSDVVSGNQTVTKARITTEGTAKYIEVYYYSYNNIENRMHYDVIGNGGGWRTIDAVVVPETPDGVTIATTYDIPFSATPITTGNRIELIGSASGVNKPIAFDTNTYKELYCELSYFGSAKVTFDILIPSGGTYNSGLKTTTGVTGGSVYITGNTIQTSSFYFEDIARTDENVTLTVYGKR